MVLQKGTLGCLRSRYTLVVLWLSGQGSNPTVTWPGRRRHSTWEVWVPVRKTSITRFSRKYGFDKEAELIQDLYLSGRNSEAEAAIPKAYLDATCLVGDEAFVRDRLQVYRDVGVTCLNAGFLGTTTEERVRNCDALKNIIEKI